MVWKNLTIGKYEIKYMPLSYKMKTLKDCTPDGKTVTKIRGMKTPDKWLDEEGKEIEKPIHKLVNGKAIPPAQPSHSIKEDKIMPTEETIIVGSEASYLVKAPLLQDMIHKEGPITFNVVLGRGYKVVRAVITQEERKNIKFLLMKTGRKMITEVPIQELLADAKGKEPTDAATEADIEILATC